MKAYFDIENLSSFARSSAKERFSDCFRMLKSHFDIILNFPKNRLREYPELMMWITKMADGARGSVSFLNDNVFPPRPLKSNTHKAFNKEQLSAVYLLNDERINSIASNGTIMYAGVGNEVETLSILIKDEDYSFDRELQIKKLRSWDEALNGHVVPTTDIIIQDRYILSDESLYNTNLYSLIGTLCQKVHNTSVNIIIFTLYSFQQFTPEWGRIRSRIKSLVKGIAGQEPKVTFVLQHRMKEHDRIIFTNYQYFVSGDSFNYFDSHGDVITGGEFLRIQSMARNEYFTNAMAFIDRMQDIINNLKDINPDGIKFDKSSLYLQF